MVSDFPDSHEGLNMLEFSTLSTDMQLLQAYESAKAEVQVPGISLSDLIGSLPEAPSPYMDELYASTQGDAILMARELRSNAAARGGEISLPLVPAFGRAEAVAQLMRDNYPTPFQVYANVLSIESVLQKRGADMLSFLALGDTSAGSIYTAVCRAYVGASKFDSQATAEVVRLDHMLVTPAQRRSLLGIHMFRELVVRVGSLGLQTIEMITLESTSYRGFKAGSMLGRAIMHLGYTVQDLGVKQIKGEGEQAECMYAIRMSKD